MSFKVNDRVVYPHHGAAIIKKKVKRELQGETKEYFVLEMVHGDLTLSVPVDKACQRDARSMMTGASALLPYSLPSGWAPEVCRRLGLWPTDRLRSPPPRHGHHIRRM